MGKTIKELAKEAIDVQDACNLSGVVHTFSRVMSDLRLIARAEGWEGTQKLNTHPIAVLFASKIASLTGSEQEHSFTYAYGWAQSEIEGGNAPIGWAFVSKGGES